MAFGNALAMGFTRSRAAADEFQALLTSLFGDGEQGAWYTRKLEYAYQDHVGIQPVTSAGQPVALRLDASRGASKNRVGALTAPAGFGGAAPYPITRDAGGAVSTGYVDSDWMVATSVEYYISPTGDDANDGLSSSSPKKSLGNLLSSLNAAPPSGATINAAPGDYVGADSFNGQSVNFPCNIVCSGIARLYHAQAVSWAKSAGLNATWEAAVELGTNSVSDMSWNDEFSIGKRLSRAPSSASGVDSTPGSMFLDGSTLYVNTFDGREPDADILVFSTGIANVFAQGTAQNLYFKGLQFLGSDKPVAIETPDTGRYVFEDCSFRYSGVSDGLRIGLSSATVILKEGDASYNEQDGYNLNGSYLHVEDGVTAVYNGIGGSDNGSTGHVEVRSIRVNGVYRYNYDRNVHDVGNCESWLVGCVAGDAITTSTDPYDSASFLFGRKGTTDQALAFVEACSSTGGTAGDLGSFGQATVHVKDSTLPQQDVEATANLHENTAVWALGNHAIARGGLATYTGEGVAVSGGVYFDVPCLTQLGTDSVQATAIIRYKNADTSVGYILHATGEQSSRDAITFGMLANVSGTDEWIFSDGGGNNNGPSTLAYRSSVVRLDRPSVSGDYKFDDDAFSAASVVDAGAYGEYPLKIAARGEGSVPWNGEISDLLVIYRQLSDEEVGNVLEII